MNSTSPYFISLIFPICTLNSAEIKAEYLAALTPMVKARICPNDKLLSESQSSLVNNDAIPVIACKVIHYGILPQKKPVLIAFVLPKTV
jgi:hypothetical protein